MRHFFTTCFLVFVVGVAALQAQDIHFSQFYMSPLTLNPALTGAFNGKIRVAGNYRNQWWKVTNSFGTPTFMTYSASAEYIIPANSWSGSRLAIGLVGFGDHAGNGALTTQQVMLSVAFHKNIDRFGKHVLSGGLQGGFVTKRVFINDLVFESQLQDLGFNTNIYHGETGFTGKPIFYPDFNLGAMFRSSPKDNFRYSIGFSMFHVARPRETLLSNTDNRLDSRYVAHASCEIDMGDFFTVVPSFLFMYQAAAQEYNGGVALKYKATDEFTLVGGVYYRHADAAVPMVGAKWKGIQGGVSYDINFSGLRGATKTQGALEIALIYVWGEDNRRHADETYCPDF
jgi:type IX secretion system PorP/SprF family membrane protein